MADGNKIYAPIREVGWGCGIEKNLSTGVNRHEIQILENNSLIEVFRTDADQCRSALESEAKRYVKRMKEENPDKSYEIKVVFNKTPYKKEIKFKGWGCGMF